MKKILVFVCLLFLFSCSESFRFIDPAKFNREISGRTDIHTPTDLLNAYYGNEKNGILTEEIGLENLPDNVYKITFICERNDDDSLFAEKIIMTAKLNGQTWTVMEIKENWKCHNGRGHTGWGTEQCN